MSFNSRQTSAIALGLAFLVGGAVTVLAADEDFPSLVTRLEKEKPQFAERQQKMLAERYDLANRAANGVTMTRGKAVQERRARQLAEGMTWDKLAAMSPAKSRKRTPGRPVFTRCRTRITKPAA